MSVERMYLGTLMTGPHAEEEMVRVVLMTGRV